MSDAVQSLRDQDRPRYVDRATFEQAIVNFLRAENPEVQFDELSAHDNLVDLGLIDSLRMVELIVAVEQIFGIDVPVDDLDPRAFHSIGSMYDRFAPDPEQSVDA